MTTDSEDEDQADMDYATQDETLEQEDLRDTSPLGSLDQGNNAHENP